VRLLMYFLLTTLLFADPVASVTSLAGGARLFTKGEIAPKNVTANANLAVGQTLKTRLESEANVKFIDNTKVIVGENSALEIVDLKKLSISGKKVLFKIAKQSDVKGLVITTPTAIIGVRGTTFMVSSDGNNSQMIYLKEGEIIVKSPKGEFKNYLADIQQEFEQFKAQQEKEFAQYTAEFSMKGATAISITGNEVHYALYTKEIDNEFKAFERF